MKHNSFDLVLTTVFFLVVLGFQHARSEEPHVFVKLTDETIEIDGKLDEAAWGQALVVRDWNHPGVKKGSYFLPSEVRFLWGRESLYVFARFMDNSIVVGDQETGIESGDSDQFEFWFKPAREFGGFYRLTVNPEAQTQFDFFPSEKNDPQRQANSHIRTQVDHGRVNDQDQSFWSVEVEVPWIDLVATGGRPACDERWQFSCWRQDCDSQGELQISTTNRGNRTNLHRPMDWNQSGILEFQGLDSTSLTKALGPREALGIQSRVKGSPDPPLPFTVQRVPESLPLKWPIFIANEPGSERYLAIEEEAPYGRTRVVRIHDLMDSGSVETLLDLSDVAYSICFHPEFERNGYFYLGSNGKRNDGPVMSRVSRFELPREPGLSFRPESEQVILEWPSNGHNGAAICFGKDGMLYVTTGDGTSDSDRNIVGQGLDHLLGKVLRIDVDHPGDGRKYSIPQDNPFVDRSGTRGETWAYGLRNPWRMTCDLKTGQLWVGNNGQDLWEQAYLVQRGANYGWSVMEGSHPFYPNRETGPDPIQKPTVEHHHSESRSLTGGVVYNGDQWPELRGAYIYGDYSTGRIWAVRARSDGTIEWHRPIADTTLQITSFALDEAGELLITDHQASPLGGVFTLRRNPQTAQANEFPRKLSETGLFKDLASHTLIDGVVPYDVNSPLWSDGAFKARYIALPLGKSMTPLPKIQFREDGTWGLPEGTVLIKSFGLELTPGDSMSRIWVETRLMVLQQGEWAGYSYRWNAEQTDGDLVASEGFDDLFEIQTEPASTLKWHYPSRTECMVCHSRAAGFVLGISTGQLNREVSYPADLELNQLEAFEQLDLLSVDWQSALPGLIERWKSKKIGDGTEELVVGVSSGSDSPQRTFAPTGLLPKSVDALPRLSDPYDPRLEVEPRVRSYLHTNCAHCHVEAGGGNAQIDLAITTPLEKMKLVGVQPLHHRFDLDSAVLVAPGHPERSVLLHRMALRENGQMPQLATNRVDTQAVKLVESWIRLLESHAKEENEQK
jgi:glucose/arabinose dehydrogenase